MLEKEQIQANKERFINLLKTINRQGADIEGLIDKLEKSDFFVAPASTQYHCSYIGGLCEHSLNVYDQLMKLKDAEYPKMVPDTYGEMMDARNECPFSDETLTIVALLHDISKMNFYEISERNTKDENGNWIKVPFIKTRESKDRFLYGSHGVNSEYMAGRFIPLTLAESVAIINHMGGKEVGSNGFDGGLSEIFNRYSLLTLLHAADMLATFLVEKMDK